MCTQKVDFIVVGQGLAGSVLAYFLIKNGQKVIVIDRYTEGGKKSSSQIAAGVINPITGMRFVKTWRIEDFLTSARAFYREIEPVLGVALWHERSILRAIRTVEEENNWLLRSSYPDYQPFCGTTTPLFDDHNIKSFYGIAEVKNAAQVNVPLLISQFRAYFRQNGLFLEANFDVNKLFCTDNHVQYEGLSGSKILFCEGAYATQNPYFSKLPFNSDKGECLLVHIPNLNLSQILKNKMSIVPLHDTEGGQQDMYWVGATNTWAFENDLPSEINKQLIINELKNILSIPFSVIEHQAAIRPTVKDRRPFIGCLSEQPNIGIFNGFGTKGASLIPFWASHFTDHLLKGQCLDKEIDILRFKI